MPHLHRLAGVFLFCAVLVGVLAPPEQRPRDSAPAVPSAASAQRGDAAHDRPSSPPGQTPSATPTPSPSRASAPTAQQKTAAAASKANELGVIPVLMYHRIVKKPQKGSLDRSLDDFREELTRLAKEGYVPITAAEYTSGRINIPAGKHPVVLTFDDAYPSHLTLDAAGNPTPDTAVGIMLEVARANPGFRPVATMYVCKDLFQMGPKARDGVRWLVQHGFEVANHTHGHKRLSDLSKDGVRKEIGLAQKMIKDLGGVDATTLAFPEGVEPDKRSWARSGEAEGAKWDFTGMFLAGWMPAHSPFHEDFDRERIPRIRSEDKIARDDCKRYCSAAWLDWLEDHPEDRYTSDGDPATVAFPESEDEHVAKDVPGVPVAY